MRSPTRSRAAISTISATSSATSCCRSSSTPGWRRSKTRSAFGDVVEAITRKMIRRHPHVFADKDGNIARRRREEPWERIKAEEKAERAARRPPHQAARTFAAVGREGRPACADARDGIAAQGLHRRLRLERPARGAQQDSRRGRRDRGRARSRDAEELAEETGDLLFALVNLARHVGADPEMALRGTNAKFERRFAYIERTLAAQGRTLESASLDEMDALWNEAKGKEQAVQVVRGHASALHPRAFARHDTGETRLTCRAAPRRSG